MNTSKKLREEPVAEYQTTFRFFEIHPDDKNSHCRLKDIQLPGSYVPTADIQYF